VSSPLIPTIVTIVGLLLCVGIVGWAVYLTQIRKAYNDGWRAYRKYLRSAAIAAGIVEKKGSRYHWLSYNHEVMEPVLMAEPPGEPQPKPKKDVDDDE